jgi:hypothetical protein
MSYREIELGYLSRHDPKEAKARILKAYEEHDANGLHTADAFGIAYRTFWRYVDALKLRDKLTQIQERSFKKGNIERRKFGPTVRSRKG